MVTRGTLNSERRGLWDRIKKQGYITPSDIDHKTTLYIETEDFVYEVKRDQLGKLTVFSGNPKLGNNPYLVGIDSHCIKAKQSIHDVLAKTLRPIFKFTHGVNIMVGQVSEILVEGEGYKYEL